MTRVFVVVLLWLMVLPVCAHQTRPAIVDIRFDSDAGFEIRIETNLESVLAGIGANHDDTDNSPQAEHYNKLRELAPERLREAFAQTSGAFADKLTLSFAGQRASPGLLRVEVPPVGDTRLARKSVLVFGGAIPSLVDQATFAYPAEYGNAVVRFGIEGEADKVSHWMKDGETSPPFRLSDKVIVKTRAQIAGDYLVLGFEHILPKGLDHILFVLGLFLFSLRLGPLLWQVTAFTVAHSITLALSIYGVISLSPTTVEPLIALSISYVAFENLFTSKLHFWRPSIVFLFGLLHGMGFASVLTDLGLPRSEFVTALITFNLGVEFGQLAVILLALTAVWFLRNDERVYRRFVVIPGSLMIGLTGLYWTWERVLG
jgi:hypothetical protein